MSISSVIRYVKALDSAATDGSGKTALAFGDITAKYLVQGGTLTSLTTEDITTLGTYQAPTDAAHIRIKKISDSDPTKGVLEIHFHNTQVASSGTKLWLFLSATGAAFQPLELDLTTAPDFDDIQSRLPAALGANGNMKADIIDATGTALGGTAGTNFVEFFDNSATPSATIMDAIATSSKQDAALLKLQKYVALLARKDSGLATDVASELGDINADHGSGAGTFANTTDSQEAIRDRGDSAWITATSVTVSDKTGFSLTSAYDPAKTAASATKLLKYVQLLARKDAGIETDNITEVIEINANGGNGDGSYTCQTDSLQAIEDSTAPSIVGILEDTNELQMDWTNGGRLDLLIDAIVAATLASAIRTAVGLASANLDTQLSTIAGYIDTEVAAIKAKTDQLTFTNANKVDAAILAAADFATAVAQKLAAIAIRRTMANIEADANGDTLSKSSLYGFIQQAQESNTVDNAGKITIYQTNGTTELGQITITTDAAADPITGAS